MSATQGIAHYLRKAVLPRGKTEKGDGQNKEEESRQQGKAFATLQFNVGSVHCRLPGLGLCLCMSNAQHFSHTKANTYLQSFKKAESIQADFKGVFPKVCRKACAG